MSVKCIPPHTTLLCNKLGAYRGIPIFLTFDPKHRLWVLLGTHNECFEQLYSKYQNCPDEIFNFYC